MAKRSGESPAEGRAGPGLSRDQLLALAERAEEILAQRQDPRSWIEANLHLRTKYRQVIPFQLNYVQRNYNQRRTRRDIILKPRQLGFTTMICGLYFADCLLRPNTMSVLVAHDLESTEQIFQIVKLFWERLPEPERRRVGKPRYSNRRELYWPRLNSRFLVGTAGSLAFGHGLTINNLHCSELSRWPKPERSLVGLLEAVPADGRIVVESTPNGMGNYFHDLWLGAREHSNGFRPHLYVWWEDPEYCIPGPPLSDLTPEEKGLKTRWEVTDDQIRWRRRKHQDLRERFREQYPEDDVTCFLTSGRCCFDVDRLLAIQRRIAAEPKPQLMPSVSDGRGREIVMAPASLRTWQPPQEGKSYVIGADVGEGLPQGDASCACVLERESGEQVAELHGRVSPDRFARLLDAVGRYYNLAMVAVERENHGHSTLNTLRNVCRYRRLYHHLRYDHLGQRTPILGWPTDQSTKPILVDDLAAAIAGHHIVIHSSELVQECLTFVTTDTGSQEAQPGKHDDRVIAAGIAWQARKRVGSRALSERPAGW